MIESQGAKRRLGIDIPVAFWPFNPFSRASVEMNALDARPGISGAVEIMNQYDIGLLGYPIWWGGRTPHHS